jgi:hypothetical protein
LRPLRPADIKRIRESANVSQAVFAAILNTSKSSVQKPSAQMQNVIAQCGRNPTVLVAAPLERSSTSRSEPFVS